MTREGLRKAASALSAALLLAAASDGTPALAEATTSPPEVSLHLSPEAIRQAGITLVSVVRSTYSPDVQAYGRVLDAAPLSDAVVGWRAAQVADRTAANELARVRTLSRDAQNASTRELEAARASAARAGADEQRAEANVIALLGPALAKDPRLSLLARRIARRQAGLVRVDVPAGGPRPNPARGARLWSYPEPHRDLAAHFVGLAPDADPLLPGMGLLFLVEKDPPPVGTRVIARLRVAGEPRSGVDVPAEALVRNAGGLFVFVVRRPGEFERRRVAARADADGRWFVEAGLAPGEQIVASGAQQLLSAERLGSHGGEVEAEEED